MKCPTGTCRNILHPVKGGVCTEVLCAYDDAPQSAMKCPPDKCLRSESNLVAIVCRDGCVNDQPAPQHRGPPMTLREIADAEYAPQPASETPRTDKARFVIAIAGGNHMVTFASLPAELECSLSAALGKIASQAVGIYHLESGLEAAEEELTAARDEVSRLLVERELEKPDVEQLREQLESTQHSERHTKAVLKTMERDLREQLAAATETINELSAANNRLEEQLAKAQKDAERLAAIQERRVIVNAIVGEQWEARTRESSGFETTSWHARSSLRDAIDAALAGKP